MVSSLFTILENHKQKYSTLARDFHEGETPYRAFRSQLVAVSCDCGVGRTMVFSASLFRVLNITLINVMSLDHASGAVLWSTSTLTLAKLGLVLFFAARSTWSGFPTAAASENTAASQNKFGGKAGKEIQATAVVVSSSGSKQGSHLKVCIGKDLCLEER